MKLEAVKYGAQLAIGKGYDKRSLSVIGIACDNGIFDVFHERIKLSDTEYLNLHGLTGLAGITVNCEFVEKKRLFKDKYGKPQPLTIIAMKREVEGDVLWSFLCDSKKLFLAIAEDFELAYTLKATLQKDDIDIFNDETENLETKTRAGCKKRNAERFVDDVERIKFTEYNIPICRSLADVLSYDAHCAFLTYLLEEGKKERELSGDDVFYWSDEFNGYPRTYQVTGCVFQMPDDRKNFHPKIERCLICESWDFNKVYKWISCFLPENIKEKVKLEIKGLRKRYGDDFEKKDKNLEDYRQSVWSGDFLPFCREIQLETDRWRKLMEDGIAEKGFAEDYLSLLREKMQILKDKLVRELDQCDFHPGSEEKCKENLLDSLEDLKKENYESGKNLWQEYGRKERRFQKILENSIEYFDDLEIQKYFEYYHMARILIDNRLNKSKDDNSRQKLSSNEDLDCAMIYFYETDTAQEAYKIQSYQEGRRRGMRGEQEVDYALTWLEAEGEYRSLPKKWSKKYRSKVIILHNPDFIKETQEYDHIVAGKQGVFVIETKNFKGKLRVDRNGNWKRKEKGDWQGVRNPVQQVERHTALLKSFMKGIPVIGVICIAHPNAIIEGTENCLAPIVKSDLLKDFIKSYPAGEKELSKEEIEECLWLLEEHRCQEA